MTQLTINLPDSTYQALKAEAERSRESIDRVITRYLSFINTPPSVSDDWSADFFTNTAGCLANTPLERAPQGDYEQRLDLL